MNKYESNLMSKLKLFYCLMLNHSNQSDTGIVAHTKTAQTNSTSEYQGSEVRNLHIRFESAHDPQQTQQSIASALCCVSSIKLRVHSFQAIRKTIASNVLQVCGTPGDQCIVQSLMDI